MLFKYLACFLAVCEEKSFSKAAQRLYISAPAVSKQMDTMEAELGLALFRRTHRGIVLTAAGEHLYQSAQKAAESLHTCVKAIQKEYAAHQTIRIGVRGPDANNMVPALLALLKERLPECEVSTVPIQPRQTVELLLNGAIDLSFTHGCELEQHPDVPVGYLELLRDTPVCYVPPAFPELKGRTCLALEDLCPYPLLIIEKGTSDFHDRIYQEVETRQLPIQMITVVEGDITTSIQQGLRPTISIGPALHNGHAYAGSLIPFSFHKMTYPVGLLCRQEDASFYKEKLLPALAERLRAVASDYTK